MVSSFQNPAQEPEGVWPFQLLHQFTVAPKELREQLFPSLRFSFIFFLIKLYFSGEFIFTTIRYFSRSPSGDSKTWHKRQGSIALEPVICSEGYLDLG